MNPHCKFYKPTEALIQGRRNPASHIG